MKEGMNLTHICGLLMQDLNVPTKQDDADRDEPAPTLSKSWQAKADAGVDLKDTTDTMEEDNTSILAN